MEYGIREHALYYACLAKTIMESSVLPEEEREPLLEAITRTYGRKRGIRMRENAHANGLPADLHAFFVTGEWAGKPGENRSELIAGTETTESHVHVCAWYDTWKQYDLLSYGTYYCRWIDPAIAEGFNGSFTLSVPCTKGQGDDMCRFVWNEPAGEPVTDKPFLLPFSFHLNELRRTAKEVLKQNVPQSMDEIMRQTETSYAGLL